LAWSAVPAIGLGGPVRDNAIMRLLVLGGTRFVGRAIVTAASGLGWEVTTFNRGVSGPDEANVMALRGDRGRAGDLVRLAGAGPWDAVVDTSGFVPRETLAVAEHLEPVVSRYLFMSTVSVYRLWPAEPLSELSEVLYCPPDAGPEYGEDTEDGPTMYGYQKAGCESAVTRTFGSDRSTILRPGVVLGPQEYVGRLPWWVRRIARGGNVLAPGAPDRSIQPVDVRDVAAFALRAVEHDLSGTYNVTAPTGRETFGGLLESCAVATHSDAELVWVPDEQLLAHRVRQWSEIPLWRTFPGTWAVDASAAQSRGLSCRPLAATVADTWSWMLTADPAAADERAFELGLSFEKERQILAHVS
jgi:2'-hydroxyisoflavone reductase